MQLANHRAREVERTRISLLGERVQLRATGIRQAHELGGLVEALARRVVHRAAEEVVLQLGLDEHEHRVAAADDEGDVGLEAAEVGAKSFSVRSSGF